MDKTIAETLEPIFFLPNLHLCYNIVSKRESRSVYENSIYQS